MFLQVTLSSKTTKKRKGAALRGNFTFGFCNSGIPKKKKKEKKKRPQDPGSSQQHFPRAAQGRGGGSGGSDWVSPDPLALPPPGGCPDLIRLRPRLPLACQESLNRDRLERVRGALPVSPPHPRTVLLSEISDVSTQIKVRLNISNAEIPRGSRWKAAPQLHAEKNKKPFRPVAAPPPGRDGSPLRI